MKTSNCSYCGNGIDIEDKCCSYCYAPNENYKQKENVDNYYIEEDIENDYVEEDIEDDYCQNSDEDINIEDNIEANDVFNSGPKIFIIAFTSIVIIFSSLGMIGN